MDWLDLKSRVYIVTGASSGIGEAIARELCANEALVVNADLRPGTFHHKNMIYIETDVSSSSSVENMVERTLDQFGKIDGLVNNAGINLPSLLVDEKGNEKYEINEAMFDKITSINQKGLYLVSQEVTKSLIKEQNGVIINMSSESGLEGSQGQSIYAGTKAAVNSFTRSWAKELGPQNIRVIGIAPGILEETGLRTEAYEDALSYTRGITVQELRESYENTNTIPLGRSGKLDEVANLVAFCLSDKASYISGITINVSGGKTRG